MRASNQGDEDGGGGSGGHDAGVKLLPQHSKGAGGDGRRVTLGMRMIIPPRGRKVSYLSVPSPPPIYLRLTAILLVHDRSNLQKYARAEVCEDRREMHFDVRT